MSERLNTRSGQQILQAFRSRSIGTRLLAAFVALVLLPSVIISAVSATTSLRNGQRQAIEHLRLYATFKENEINSWLDGLQSELTAALSEAEDIQDVRDLLNKSGSAVHQMRLSESLSHEWTRFADTSAQIDGLQLLDLQGRMVVSTDDALTTAVFSNQALFQEALFNRDVYLVYSSTVDRVIVVVTRPVKGKEGKPLGILVGYANVDLLNDLLREWTGLGKKGKVYLVGSDHIMLTSSQDGKPGIWVETWGANTALQTQGNGAGVYDDYRAESVLGAFRWLPRLRAALLVEQDQKEVLGPIYSGLLVIGSIALFAVLIAVTASLFITRGIASPLAILSDTASKIASGNLQLQADVKREDEIGSLARAFNSMTAQLRGLIAGLEAQVAERTLDLERRSTYLEAASEVGRAAASILEIDHLMRQVVEVIRVRFGLYYVGLFRVDERREWAVLSAGTGEAGRAMLARGHRIKIGEGMIGWSIANAQPRIALQVEDDSVRLFIGELPDTRSEAALPLRSRGQVLGALSVQSDQPGFFDESIITVLQMMADQVAVALDNAQLFAESQAALEAQRRAYSIVSHEAWTELLRTRQDLGFHRDQHGTAPITFSRQELLSEEFKALNNKDNGRTIMRAIRARDQVIGVLKARIPEEASHWTAAEIELLDTLVDQLGNALESARLYQETQRRARRERLVTEITGKIRAAPDMDGILRTAVQEIRRALGVEHGAIRLGTETHLKETADSRLTNGTLHAQRKTGQDSEGGHSNE